MARIGVLALQGGFQLHVAALQRLQHEVAEIRSPADFAGLDGLVLPGGESTAQLRLIEWGEIDFPLREFVQSGRPVLATCAGLILSATQVRHPQQRSFGFLDVTVSRNAWGRQVDSFETMDDAGERKLVFIRAPKIVEVGDGVAVLLRWRGEPILARQQNVTGATFHPELSGTWLHNAVFSGAGSTVDMGATSSDNWI